MYYVIQIVAILSYRCSVEQKKSLLVYIVLDSIMEKWLCKFLDKLSSELTKIAVTKVKLIGPFIMICDTSGNI